MAQKQYMPLALLWDIIAMIWAQLVRFINERVEAARERAHGRGDVIVVEVDNPPPQQKGT